MFHTRLMVRMSGFCGSLPSPPCSPVQHSTGIPGCGPSHLSHKLFPEKPRRRTINRCTRCLSCVHLLHYSGEWHHDLHHLSPRVIEISGRDEMKQTATDLVKPRGLWQPLRGCNRQQRALPFFAAWIFATLEVPISVTMIVERASLLSKALLTTL